MYFVDQIAQLIPLWLQTMGFTIGTFKSPSSPRYLPLPLVLPSGSYSFISAPTPTTAWQNPALSSKRVAFPTLPAGNRPHAIP